MNFEDGVVAGVVLLAVLSALAVCTFLARRFIKRSGARKFVLLCGTLAFLLCGLFPPWFAISSQGHTHSIGYSIILWPPDADRYGWTKLDLSRLSVEWLCILVAAGAAYSFLGGKPAPAPAAPPASAPLPLPAGAKAHLGVRRILQYLLHQLGALWAGLAFLLRLGSGAFSNTKKWIVIGTISTLSVFAIALLLINNDQAQIIEQVKAKAAEDAQLQQERERQWQAFAAQQSEKRQKAVTPDFDSLEEVKPAVQQSEKRQKAVTPDFDSLEEVKPAVQQSEKRQKAVTPPKDNAF